MKLKKLFTLLVILLNSFYSAQCTLSKSGSWSFSPNPTTVINGVTTTVTSSSVSGSNTSLTFIGNDTFNSQNFWSSTNGIPSSTSLNLLFTWDTTPENGISAANTDGGTRGLTINFSQPVSEFILHIDRLGGYSTDGTNYYSNGTVLSLTSSNISMQRLNGNTQFEVNTISKTITRTQGVFLGNTQPSTNANNTTGTAAGTIKFSDTSGVGFTSISFNLSGGGYEGDGSDGMELIFELCPTPITAVSDAATGVEGTTFNSVSLRNNDNVNDTQATSSNTTLSTIGAWFAGITLNSTTGIVNIQNTVPPGIYQLNYNLCINGVSPTSCSQSYILIRVLKDSDGDGIADDNDLDDDNDGILDTAECSTISYNPVYHLYDSDYNTTSNVLQLYKQDNGIGSAFVCPTNNCSANPAGALYENTNILGNVDNLAYDDGKYYYVDNNGMLYYTGDLINSDFSSLGNSNIGTGYKNLGYDNGIFYHWKLVGNTNTVELYSTPDPINIPWISMGIVTARPFTYNSSGFTYELKDITVNNGVFYFMYYALGSPNDFNSNNIRTQVFSSSTPNSLTPNWQNLGSTYFGNQVYNLAIGSQDVLVACDNDGDGIPNYLDLDSDNDGCPDAIEGGENVASTMLVNASGSLTVGTGSTATNQNLGNTVDAQGVPTIVNSGGAADTGSATQGTQGQLIGSSQNASINSCVCYRDPINNGTGSETKMGITLLKRAGSNDPDNWPMVRKSGHIALESNTQGFVVTRIAKADLGNITNPQEGMMVYDTTDKCLKIYSDSAWKCFSTPACP